MTSNKTMIDDEMIRAFARTLLPGIREYFGSEKGQQEYAQWMAKKGRGDKERS